MTKHIFLYIYFIVLPLLSFCTSYFFVDPIKNIGSRFGGSITAAQFIKRFVNNNIPWAHIDIAGVTWLMSNNGAIFSKISSPGATAFGIRLIDNFLKGK